MRKYAIVSDYRSQNLLDECSHTSSGYLWESEPSWSFDIRAVSDIEKALSERISESPPFGWDDLGSLAKDLLEGSASVPVVLNALRNIRPASETWGQICQTVERRLESTRPSRRRATLLVCLELSQKWLDEPNELLLQALDFNRIFLVRPDPAKPPTYLPSRTAIMRSSRTRSKCATASPRFHPTPEEFTLGRHDYEGLCEAMWLYTRSTEFECWRVGRAGVSDSRRPYRPVGSENQPVI